MRTLRLFVIFGALLALALPATAQTSYVLTIPATVDVQSFAASHGLTVVREIHDGTNCVYVVTSASSDVTGVETEVETDVRVTSFEANAPISLPETLNGLTGPVLTQSTAGILETLPGRTLVTFFGSTVPSNYITQTATTIIRLPDARAAYPVTGAGIIAIIDTGVDPQHPALAGVLVPGFDFVHNTSGIPSEFSDAALINQSTAGILEQSTAGILEQSTAGILEAQNVVPLNSYTAAILDQSTAGILEGLVPQDFGHGTMTAGVAHLIAPTAKIMPLKAFTIDGMATASDIIRAIYFAADNGANVISMSFSMPANSPSLQAAIQYALGKNIVVVASSGNDGLKTLVYPASIGGVHGVGSTTNADGRSAFSNYGSGVVLLAAPGEGVITTYPGGNYAAGWGTSFSAPMVAGAASLVLQARPASKPGDVLNALSKAKQISDMGYGRIDLYQALNSVIGGSSSISGTSGSNTSGSTSGGSSKP
ncbi:MAG: S8 family serine peptidase [Acidobacteriia bacterium]|nr:S8 family serine peptidase [Terriglobia bacterium]